MVKKSELRKLIREEIQLLSEASYGGAKVIRVPIKTKIEKEATKNSLSHRGKKVMGLHGQDTGFKFGEKVNYKGRTMIVLDSDADNKAPQGITLRLVDPSLKYFLIGIVTDLVKSKRE